MDIKKRLTNPWFYVTLVALFLSTTHIDPESLTSWPILIEKVKAVFMNPYLLFTFLVALLGQIMNPTTKGIKD